MKRLFFTASALFMLMQARTQEKSDSTGYLPRKLKLDEINFISSYYSQDGDNAAVTGGIGSQKLTDIANVFDIKFIKYDRKLRKHSLDFELGIDHYTSASSDRVDLKANTSASYSDTRFYPSVNWSIENEQKGTTLGVGAAVSAEYDYMSYGGNISFAKKTKDKNGEFSARFQAYLDQVSMIIPEELRNTPADNTKGSQSRNTLAAAFSYSQIVNKNLQVAFLADVVTQQGYLGLPFYRVYFADGSVHKEKLPERRLKIPIGIRASYFTGDKIIIRSYYRFYTDDWGVRSHTFNLELPVKLSPFVSVSPFYRFYTQGAVKYFAPYGKHTAQSEFYTSNYDLSKFNSNFVGAGVRLTPARGVFGIKKINMLELRYGHYTKNIDMNANIVSLHLRFK